MVFAGHVQVLGRALLVLGGVLATTTAYAAALEYQLIRNGNAEVPSGMEAAYLVNYSCRPTTGGAGRTVPRPDFYPRSGCYLGSLGGDGRAAGVQSAGRCKQQL